MAYKKDCGFRNKVHVCSFKEEDCCPEKCDMYDIPFEVKALSKRIKEERKHIIELENKRQGMKKKGEHKTNKEEYDKVKNLRNDKVYGILKLTKAYTYLKRTKT